jgi:hypothetical protein
VNCHDPVHTWDWDDPQEVPSEFRCVCGKYTFSERPDMAVRDFKLTLESK